MKQKITYIVTIFALITIGIIAGVNLTNYQDSKVIDKAFKSGAVTVDNIKAGKSAEVYKNALADYTGTTTLEALNQAVTPFTDTSIKNGSATLYSDNSGGHVFIQEYLNDKSEYVGQISVSLLKKDDGSFVVSNILINR